MAGPPVQRNLDHSTFDLQQGRAVDAARSDFPDYFAHDSWQFNSMTQSKIDADDDENDENHDDDDEKFHLSIRWLMAVSGDIGHEVGTAMGWITTWN